MCAGTYRARWAVWYSMSQEALCHNNGSTAVYPSLQVAFSFVPIVNIAKQYVTFLATWRLSSLASYSHLHYASSEVRGEESQAQRSAICDHKCGRKCSGPRQLRVFLIASCLRFCHVPYRQVGLHATCKPCRSQSKWTDQPYLCPRICLLAQPTSVSQIRMPNE